MKKVKNTCRILSVALFISLTALIHSPVLANDINDNSTSELKYVGTEKNQSVFQLNLNNAEAEEFIITIRDGNNFVLYSGRAKGKMISRTFRLNADEISLDKLKFEVTSRQNNEKIVYEVNKTVRYVQDVEVNKLK